MKLNKIKERESFLNKSWSVNRDVNFNSIKEQCMRLKDKGRAQMETFVNNWEAQFKDNTKSLKDVLKISIGWANECKIEANSKYINTVLEENIIPKTKNLELCKSIIEECDSSIVDKQKMINECDEYIAYDRVIYNKHLLDEHMDLTNRMKKARFIHTESTEELIADLCNEISDMSDDNDINFNVCVENIIYGLYNAGINVDKEEVYAQIENYFYSIEEDNQLLNYIIENNKMCKDIVLSTINEESIYEGFREDKFIPKKFKKGNKANKKELPVIVKIKNKLLGCKNQEQIVEELPNILGTITMTIINLGAFGINPLIGLLTLASTSFIKMESQRKAVDKYIKNVDIEIKKVERKLDSAKRETTIDNLEKYLNKLEKEKEKMEEYKDELYSDIGRSYNESAMSEIDYMSRISEQEWLLTYKTKFISEAKKSIESVTRFSKARYPDLTSEPSIIEYLEHPERLEQINEANIDTFVNDDGYVYTDVAFIKPFNRDIRNSDLDKRCEELLRDVIEYLNEQILSNGYKAMFEKEVDEYHIHLVCTEARLNEVERNRSFARTIAFIHFVGEEVQKFGDHVYTAGSKVDTAIRDYNPEEAESIASFMAVNSDIIPKEEMNEMFKSQLKEIKNKVKPNYWCEQSIRDCMYEINNGVTRTESLGYKNDIVRLVMTNEFFDMVDNRDILLNEAGYVTKIKMMRNNLVKNATKLSDKEKELSKKMDNSLYRMQEKIEKELVSKNRESVIKGSILPSFSTTLKLAMTSGVVSIVNPALGLITLMGGLATSKAATKKERKYILDEIELELKLVEKKIQLAESNNDMKALEQLMRIEQRLKKEHSRIFYNLKHRPYRDLASNK